MAAERKVEKIKVFISYSRRDADAADVLVEALLARGFEVTIDRRDLPFGEKWQAELAEFIRLSDTVVWLVSEASIQSKWVNWELDEVARRNKRLVPVMIAETARDALPRQLGEIHILPAAGVFESLRDLDELVRVLETDRAWLKEASRLQDRAAEWLAKSRTSALLLSRGSLSDAERWKDRHPAKAPPPAQEILDLLLASRQSATKRQRWWVGGSLGVAVSALTLAAFAYFQSLEAERQREEAVTQRQQALAARDSERIARTAEAEQRRVAQANEDLAKREAVEAEKQRKLAHEQRGIAERNEQTAELERQKAVESEGKARQALRDAQVNVSLFRAERADALFRQNEKTTAMLLALEAVPDPSSKDPVRRDWPEVPEARRVLLQSLAETTEQLALFGHTQTVQAVVFDPSGKRLATAALDRSVRIWDASTGTLLRILTEVGLQSFPSFSPDGTVLLTNESSGDGGKLWEVATGKLIGRTPFPPSQIYERTPNANGTHAVAKMGQDFAVWSGDIWKGNPQPVPVDRQLLSSSSIVRVNDTGTLGLAVVRNLATIWDARNGAKLRDLQGHSGPISAAAFGKNGEMVITASGSDVRVWDAQSGKLLGKMLFDSSNPLTRVEMNKSGNKALEKLLADGPFANNSLPYRLTGVELNNLGDRALLIFDGENAILMDVGSGRKIETLYHSGLVTAAFSPDGNSVLTLSQSQDAIHWDARTGARIQTLTISPSSIQSAAFDPLGTRIATGAANGQAKIWSVSKKIAPVITAPAAIDCRTYVWVPNAPPTRSGELPSGESNNENVETPTEFAEVMRYLGRLESYSTSKSRLGVRYTDEEGRAEKIGLHRERGIAVTIGYNLQDPNERGAGLLIWNLKTQTLIGRISNVLPGRIWGFHIRPDGKRILAYGDQGAVAVFDIEGQRKVFDMVGHTDIVSAGCFSPDGASIVTAGFDGKAHIWDAGIGRITQSIDLKVKRPSYANFTTDGRGVVVGMDTEDPNEKGVLIPIAARIDVAAPADQIVARAQARVPRCLTPLERRQYILEPEPPGWCAALGKPPYNKTAK